MRTRASLISVACVVLACGSRGQVSESSGAAEATGSSDTAVGDSDGASELPPGCGDGIVDPEQFCFEPVLVPGLAQVGFIHGIDLDGDGRDEIIVGYDNKRAGDYPCDQPTGFGSCFSVFAHEDGAFVHRQALSGSRDLNELRSSAFLENLDGDGATDMMLMSPNAGARFSLYRNIDGKLAEREVVTVAAGSGFGMIAPVDPDGDGVLDYLVPWKDVPLDHIADYIQLRRKVGDEYLPIGPRFDLPPCWYPNIAAVGDLTGNGLNDAVFVAALGACDHVPGDLDPDALFQAFVFFANPETGLMEAGPRLPRGGNFEARGLWLADVSGNGHLDLVFRLEDAEDAIVVNRGDGTFEDVRVVGQVSQGEVPTRRVESVADFNGDGLPDFIGGRPTMSDAARGFLVDPVGARRVHAPDPDDAFGSSVKGDVNGDGITDLYRVEDTDDPLLKRVYILVSRP